jgi:hypothetical protein
VAVENPYDGRYEPSQSTGHEAPWRGDRQRREERKDGVARQDIAKGKRIALELLEATHRLIEKASAPGGNGGGRDREVDTGREFGL